MGAAQTRWPACTVRSHHSLSAPVTGSPGAFESFELANCFAYGGAIAGLAFDPTGGLFEARCSLRTAEQSTLQTWASSLRSSANISDNQVRIQRQSVAAPEARFAWPNRMRRWVAALAASCG